MKFTKKQLEETVKEVLQKKLKEALEYSDIFPGDGKLGDFAEKVDNFLKETHDKAMELRDEAEGMMKPNMFGGDASAGPSAAQRVGERNRFLMSRAGGLKKLAAACTSLLEFLRREG